MCEVLDRIENRGIATGLARGREEGLATGRKEGLETGLATGRKEGLATGRKEGLAKGLSNGIASTQTLISRLLEANRLDDLRRASSDREYLQQLLEEEGLLPE